MDTDLVTRLSLSLSKKGRRLPVADRLDNPAFVAKAIKAAIESGQSRKEIAIEIFQGNGDASMIAILLNVLKLPTQIQEMVIWGKVKNGAGVGLSAASQISKFNEENMMYVFEECMKSEFTKDEVMSIRQLSERSDSSLEECVERIVGRRPYTRKLHLWLRVPSDEVKNIIKEMPQQNRDELFSKTLKSLDLDTVKGRLGMDMIALLGGKILQVAIARKGFESSLMNSILANHVGE